LILPTLVGEEREQALTVKEEVHESLCLQLGWHRGNITLVPCIYTRDGSFFVFYRNFLHKKVMVRRNSAMSISIPRGTQDILPGEVEKWQLIEAKARELCEKYQ
jgi:hypothetical protein